MSVETVETPVAVARLVRPNAVVVRGAGVLPWRLRKGRLQVALVHRPRYDDWAWAKGKLERGEDAAAAAAREAEEEIGYSIRLGMPLPLAVYPLAKHGSRDVIKRVEYWAATTVGGTGSLHHEIDAVRWLTPSKARRALTYPRDQLQLDALVQLASQGLLDTWNLLVVRHAKALPRKSWSKADPLRPLNTVGKRRARRLVPIITAYAPERVVTSPSSRCHDTVSPFAQSAVVPLRTKRGLSEEGYDAHPEKVHEHVQAAFDRARPVAFCTHGPLLGAVVTDLRARASTPEVSRTLRRVLETAMDKGEVLACTVSGRGAKARIVAATRHRIPR